MIITGTTISGLIRTYNLQNANVLVSSPPDPYDGKIDQTTSADPELYKSSIGTPVVIDLTFQGGTYTLPSGQKYSFDDLTLQTVLCTVSQAKRIVTTEIQGRNGTVKEYIGMDDYQITINGILTGANGQFPIDDVNSLQQICKAPIPINVVSRYLQIFDIYQVVIKDFSYEQQPGAYSLQNFTLSCLSDAPVILQISS
jgi:hypothetical protein